MSEARARLVLGALVAGLLATGASLDVPRLSGGRFWSDAATYYAATLSLVEDADVEFEARDLLRVRRRYEGNPEGVFLKRAAGGFAWAPDAGFPWLSQVPDEAPRVYYAKALLHPVVAAPFVWLLGDRGFPVLNAVALAACLLLAYLELRRRAGPAASLALASVLFLGTITPLYLFWIMPELLNVALLAGALSAWRSERPVLSALLFGLATYSKPSNVLVAVPLGVAPLLVGRERWLAGLGETLRRGAILLGAVGLMYGANRVVTGEWNYQGGRERKTFHGHFPFDEDGHTFGNTGTWMSTNQLGPLVEGQDDARVTRQTGPARASGEVRASFVRNLGYFWVGRFGGAVPYFFPVVLAALLFIVVGPRDRAGWLALAALGVSWLAYIWIIPDNWYGGGGTVGNRYFLNLVPLAAFFVPAGRAAWLAVVGALSGLVLVFPILASPMLHSLDPGRHATRAAFRAFPAELTMLNDLSVFTQLWRKKRSVGDTEGDAHKHWPADPRAYYLYFPDDGTCERSDSPAPENCGLLERDGRLGFRLGPQGSAEIIVRALEPVREMHFSLVAGPTGDEIEIAQGGQRASAVLRAGESADLTLAPSTGFAYYDTFVYVVRLRLPRSTGEARANVPFVSIALDVEARPRE